MRWIRYLPCITFWWLTITLIIGYIIALIRKKREDDDIPDLTKIRSVEPIGSIFGCLLHVSAKLLMATVNARHKIVKLQLWCSWRKNKLAKFMNRVSWILGIIMSLLFAIQSAVSVATNEAKRLFSLHIMYIFPLLYLICQTILECLLKWGDRKVRKLNMIRILICVLYSLIFFVGIIVLYMWYKNFNFQLDNQDRGEYKKHFNYHQYMIAAAFSWLRVFLLAFYFLLFRYDFRKTDWLFSAKQWYPQGTTFRGLNIKDFYI